MKYKTVATVAILTLILVLALWWAWWFLSTGKLEVTAPEKVEVSIVEIDENQRAHNVIGSGSFTQRLSPGEYTLVGETEAGEGVQKTVTINIRQTTGVNLAPAELTTAEEILSGSSRSIIADARKFRFLDGNLNLLHELERGSQQAEPIFYGLYPVSRVDWIDTDNAFIQLRDNYQVLQNGQVREFRQPPGEYPDNIVRFASYDLNERGQIAVLVGDEIFFYENLASRPQKIYETNHENMSVHLSNDGRIFAHTDAFAFSHSESENHSLLIDRNGEEQELSEPIESGAISYASWSPDSENLLVEIDGELQVHKPESGTSELLMQHPPENIEAIAWISNQEFLVVKNQALWSMSLVTKQLDKRVNLPTPIKHADAFTLFEDELLFSTSPSSGFDDAGTFYRVEL